MATTAITLNKRKPIILVDMDGVLANFQLECLTRWRQKYPKSPFIPLEEIKNHDLCKDYESLHEGYGELMKAIYYQDDFYDNLPVINGALPVLDEMLDAGYEVFICTAPLRSAHCMTAKIQWMNHHFGNKWIDRMILTRDKTLICGDILIDDKPQITGLIKPHFVHILFDQPFNRNEPKNRITQWSNWRSTISPVLTDLGF